MKEEENEREQGEETKNWKKNGGHHKQISSGVEGCPVNEKLSKYYQTERSGL